MARSLRVVIPALTYVPDRMGGSETYVKALVDGLQERDDVDLTVIASEAGAEALGARVQHVMHGVAGGASTVARITAIARGARADRTSRRLLAEADVVHYPFTIPVPLPPRGVPWVQTLLDVHRGQPELFSRAERAYRALMYEAPARRASRVITISEFCREQISRSLGVPRGRIDVAHLGVDVGRFKFKAGPRKPFVLYPAAVWPHKNHARLIEAMEIVRTTRPELGLVLTGGRRNELGELPGWVDHRGFVSDDELAGLYQDAACLVFPSLYEGFGLPPLEAMASGCPAATSTSGSLPEICGDAAVLFEPHDARTIAEGVLTALSRAGELRRAGSARAARFTWADCADAHEASYRRAIAHRASS